MEGVLGEGEGSQAAEERCEREAKAGQVAPSGVDQRCDQIAVRSAYPGKLSLRDLGHVGEAEDHPP